MQTSFCITSLKRPSLATIGASPHRSRRVIRLSHQRSSLAVVPCKPELMQAHTQHVQPSPSKLLLERYKADFCGSTTSPVGARCKHHRAPSCSSQQRYPHNPISTMPINKHTIVRGQHHISGICARRGAILLHKPRSVTAPKHPYKVSPFVHHIRNASQLIQATM